MSWPTYLLALGILLTLFAPPAGIPLILASLLVLAVRRFLKPIHNVTKNS
ncbi:hypothetical protein BH11VER1_BH11VER1_07750 [soil metagenome]